MTVPAVPAATVLLVRDGARGLEVFLVKRHQRSGFMPSVWVFPGGRVEPEDHAVPPARAVGGAATAAAFGEAPERGRGWLVGAARETFEEAGVWLGAGGIPVSERVGLQAGARGLADLLAAHDATLGLDQLRPWSRWVTPEAVPRRFDTWFLWAEVDGGDDACHDTHETVASGWFRPVDVLDAGPARMPLAPPTWWTVKELADAGSRAGLQAAARSLAPILPHQGAVAGQPAMVLPGGPGHAEPVRHDLPPAILFTAGGWRRWRP